MYRLGKLVVKEEKCNLILQVTRAVLNTRGWDSEQKKKTWTSVGNVKCHGLFHIVFVLNGHMPFGGE